MDERRTARRGPATTLRVVGGVVAVLAPFVLGALGHSPWKALMLVPAFAASYAIGRAAGPRPLASDRSAVAIAGVAVSVVAVQLVIVALLYGLGLGVGALLGDVLPLEPLTSGDVLFVAIVWAVTLGCAGAALSIERSRSTPTPLD